MQAVAFDLLFKESLKQALAINLPYSTPERTPLDQSSFHKAAVLILFGARKDGGPEILLTLRTEHVETHKNQVAFPGGKVDQEDHSAKAAALRETQEEVGIAGGEIEVLGNLPEMLTVTSFQVTPIVALLKGTIDSYTLKPNPQEIAEVFWVPLSTLKAPGCYRQEFVGWQGKEYPIHVYQVGKYRIWGATAEMLRNLLERFACVYYPL